MIYQLKRFLKVTDVSKTDCDTYNFKLGFFTEDEYELEGTENIIYLLSMLDGSNSLSQIKKNLCEKYKDITDEEFFNVITTLENNGIIERNTNQTMFLSPEEVERYDRHLLYYSIFSGQQYKIQDKLKKSKVALIGMGGIGCWTSYALAGAGVGTIIGIDNDIIESSNLTRQILYTESDLGKYKVDIAAQKIKQYNSFINFIPVKKHINSTEDIINLLGDVDFVVLSADHPSEIHKWVDEACMYLNIPYSNVGYINYIGVCGPMIIPNRTNGEYSKRIHEELQEEYGFSEYIKQINSRYQPPSYGAINGVVSCMQAMEVIKHLTHFTEPKTLDCRYLWDSYTMEGYFQDF